MKVKFLIKDYTEYNNFNSKNFKKLKINHIFYALEFLIS